MDGTKIDKIEDFSNITADIKMIGYSPASNKIGTVPISAVQSKVPYCGCRWRKDSASTEGEPIGDLQMLANLQSILGLGGYLVQNDHSRRKLAVDNHFKFASGGDAKLDGSMGHYQWGWNIPWYYCHYEDEIYEYEQISTAPMSGRWNYKIPVASFACAGASALDRTNNILVSYCNRTAQYRGGNNNADLDGKWNTMLGKPVVSVAENSLQRYAEKNGERWGATMFPLVFCIGILTRIMFHNRSIQAARKTELTKDGLMQGGLGYGVDNVNASFGNQYATVDIDALADKGDVTGVYSLEVKDGDTTKLTIKNIPVFCGLKNFYHYIYEMEHGCNMVFNSDKFISIYAQRYWNKDVVNTYSTTGMRQLGVVPPAASEAWYFVKKMNLDGMLMFPTEFGGSEGTYYGDAFYHLIITPGLRGLLALGYANYGGNAGVGCINGYNGPGNARVNNGAALNNIYNARQE